MVGFERGKGVKDALDIGVIRKMRTANIFIGINWGRDLCKPQNQHLRHLAELYYETSTGLKCEITVVDEHRINIRIIK